MASKKRLRGRLGLPTTWMFIRVFSGTFEKPSSFHSSSSSTIAIILRSAEVFCGSVCPSYAKIRFQYFFQKTILTQKKLFVAVRELHDNMKALIELLNNRTRRQKWSKQLNKETKKYKQTFLRTPQNVSQNLVKISRFCNFHLFF